MKFSSETAFNVALFQKTDIVAAKSMALRSTTSFPTAVVEFERLRIYV